MLLTTQYVDEADQLADRIAVVDRGRVVAEGTSAELKRLIGGARLEATLIGPDPPPSPRCARSWRGRSTSRRTSPCTSHR